MLSTQALRVLAALLRGAYTRDTQAANPKAITHPQQAVDAPKIAGARGLFPTIP